MIISFLRFLLNRTAANGRRARAEILDAMPKFARKARKSQEEHATVVLQNSDGHSGGGRRV